MPYPQELVGFCRTPVLKSAKSHKIVKTQTLDPNLLIKPSIPYKPKNTTEPHKNPEKPKCVTCIPPSKTPDPKLESLGGPVIGKRQSTRISEHLLLAITMFFYFFLLVSLSLYFDNNVIHRICDISLSS